MAVSYTHLAIVIIVGFGGIPDCFIFFGQNTSDVYKRQIKNFSLWDKQRLHVASVLPDYSYLS